MIRRFTASLVASLLISAGPALAQGGGAPARRRPRPRRFRSKPSTSSKCRTALHMGEAVGVATNSKGHVFVSTRSGESARVRIRSDGRFRQRVRQGAATGMRSATPVRVDKDDNVWVVDEGTNIIQKFDANGKLVMVLGKRPDPPRPARRDAGWRALLRRQPSVYVPSADRHRLGSAGQHLRVRRLRRQPRREFDTERQVHQGRRQRAATGRCSSARRMRSLSTPKAWSTWPTAATRGSSCSTTI